MFSSFNSRASGLTLTNREAIELAAGAGFVGVDLMVRDLIDAGDDPRELRSRMNDLGLRGGAFPLPMAWRGGVDEYRRDLARLPRYAEAAAILGLERTGTWVMPETELTHEATVALHVERLGAIARVLGAHGVRLGLEVIGVASSRIGRGKPFVHRLADLSRTLGAVLDPSENLGVLVDAFHLYAAGESVEAALAWGVSRVVWVHVADLPASANPDRAKIRDQDRGLPGENGAVESRTLLERLAGLGYDGPVTAEPMAGCQSLVGLSDEQAVRRIRTAMQSVWPDRAGQH